MTYLVMNRLNTAPWMS